MVLGERAGLIRAKHIDAAEVMDRRKLFHNDAVLRHLDRALRKIARDDERQKFRREPDRDRDGEEKYLQGVAPIEKNIQKNDGEHQE